MEIIDGYIRTLLVDSKGNLWIGTRGSGLIQYHNGTFLRHLSNNDKQSNDIRILYESADGTIWIGAKNGLAKMSENVLSNTQCLYYATGFETIERNGLKELDIFYELCYNVHLER